MSTAAVPLDEWQLQFHEAMAAILGAKEKITRQAGILGITYGLWSVTRDLKNIIRLLVSTTSVPDGLWNDTLIESTISSTSVLVRSIEDLLDTAKSKGFTNRALTAGPLEIIRKRGEEIAEYLDAFRLSIDPEVEAAIRQGRQDFADGLGIPLDLPH